MTSSFECCRDLECKICIGGVADEQDGDCLNVNPAILVIYLRGHVVSQGVEEKQFCRTAVSIFLLDICCDAFISERSVFYVASCVLHLAHWKLTSKSVRPRHELNCHTVSHQVLGTLPHLPWTPPQSPDWMIRWCSWSRSEDELSAANIGKPFAESNVFLSMWFRNVGMSVHYLHVGC